MRQVVYRICLGMLLGSQAVMGQENPELDSEARDEQSQPNEASRESQLDDLDLKELEYQIQQREQSLPMLWNAIYTMESRPVDDDAAAEITQLRKRSEQVKNEIRELRVELKRNAPQPTSPVEARARAAELLRQAEEILSQEGDDVGLTSMVRSIRIRVTSDRDASQSRSGEWGSPRIGGFSPPSTSSRFPEELMERIRNASPERLEKRVEEQGETLRQLQAAVERLEEVLKARQPDEADEGAVPQ